MNLDYELHKNVSPWQIDAWDTIPPLLHGKLVGLLHRDDLHRVPEGTVLVGILGHTIKVDAENMDEINTDERGGYLPWGLPLGYWDVNPEYLNAYCKTWHAHYGEQAANKMAPTGD